MGLVVGLILGFFVGTYWMTVLYCVLIGAALGVVANLLALIGVGLAWKGRKRAAMEVGMSPDMSARLFPYAEKHLREHSPSDFVTTPKSAVECADIVRRIVDEGWWGAGYDSLDSFYAAHEERHPDIRFYAEVSRENPMDEDLGPTDELGEVIVRRIALRRASTGTGS